MHHPVDVQALDATLRLLRPQAVRSHRHRLLYVKLDILQEMAPWEGGGR